MTSTKPVVVGEDQNWGFMIVAGTAAVHQARPVLAIKAWKSVDAEQDRMFNRGFACRSLDAYGRSLLDLSLLDLSLLDVLKHLASCSLWW